MLVARNARELILAELDGVAAACARLADEHRATPMAGRTLLQQAVPTTFGLKAAGWLVGVVDARARLAAVRAAGAARRRRRNARGARRPRAGGAARCSLRSSVSPSRCCRGTRAARRVAELGDALAAVARGVREDRPRRRAARADRGRRGLGGRRRRLVDDAAQAEPDARGRSRARARAACTRRPACSRRGEHEHERAAGAWHAEWGALSDALALDRRRRGGDPRVPRRARGPRRPDAREHELGLVAERVAFALARARREQRTRSSARRSRRRSARRARRTRRAELDELLDRRRISARRMRSSTARSRSTADERHRRPVRVARLDVGDVGRTQLPALAGRRVLRYDHPGHGGSPVPAGRRVGDLAARVLDELGSGARLVLRPLARRRGRHVARARRAGAASTSSCSRAPRPASATPEAWHERAATVRERRPRGDRRRGARTLVHARVRRRRTGSARCSSSCRSREGYARCCEALARLGLPRRARPRSRRRRSSSRRPTIRRRRRPSVRGLADRHSGRALRR